MLQVPFEGYLHLKFCSWTAPMSSLVGKWNRGGWGGGHWINFAIDCFTDSTINGILMQSLNTEEYVNLSNTQLQGSRMVYSNLSLWY